MERGEYIASKLSTDIYVQLDAKEIIYKLIDVLYVINENSDIKILPIQLTIEQKAELFDWMCLRIECEPFEVHSDGDNTDFTIRDIKTKNILGKQAAIQEALYQAFLNDQ